VREEPIASPDEADYIGGARGEPYTVFAAGAELAPAKRHAGAVAMFVLSLEKPTV
jgi:hypothetical protein